MRDLRSPTILFVAYILTFLLSCFIPQGLAITDEYHYLSEAARLTGQVHDGLKPLLETTAPYLNNQYAIGTPFLEAPLYYFWGVQGARLTSVLAVGCTLFCISTLLRNYALSAGYSVLFILYLPTLVVGRFAMSDVPSAALTSAALLFLLRGYRGNRWFYWASSSLVAGLSMLVRETNAVILVPFYIGAFCRTLPSWRRLLPLLLGGVVGAGIAVAVLEYQFGGLTARGGGYGWSAHAAFANAWLYSVALLLLVPGGLIGVALYHGPYRWEVLISTVSFVLIYLFYDYSGADSGTIKRLVLGPRFFIPVLPVLILALGHTTTRLCRELNLPRFGFTQKAAVLLVALSCVAILVVQWQVSAYCTTSARISAEIKKIVPINANVFTNLEATLKFLPNNSRYKVAATSLLKVQQFVQANEALFESYLVKIDRDESQIFINQSISFDALRSALQKNCSVCLETRQKIGSNLQLTIWRVNGCSRAQQNY